MHDMREALKHGDKTGTGGVLMSTVIGFTHHGVAVAAEGDHATCPACKVGGPVMNDAYPHFTLMDGRQILVRGARVMCQCTDKPLVIPSQRDFIIQVNRAGRLQPSTAPGTYAPSAAEKLSDGPSRLVDDSDRICANMSNAEFRSLVLRLRDTAVLCCGKRLVELRRWGHADRARVETWFGVSDERVRQRLLEGIPHCLNTSARLLQQQRSWRSPPWPAASIFPSTAISSPVRIACRLRKFADWRSG
ncbi:hypothetical protein CF70_034435 [Cupriavidus sp. SK-3]|nr:hypothetical protein CF70_034435 [Cupriavidus sp. SK-3]